MPATSDAGSDPEAARPPATSARACHPLPWALSAALLLLAAACAYCALRAWAPGAPGPGPPPDAQPPASLELPPDAGARLPAASQVRRSPTWAPGSPLHPHFPRGSPFCTPCRGIPTAPLGRPRAPLLYPGRWGAPLHRGPREHRFLYLRQRRGLPLSLLAPGEPRLSPGRSGTPHVLPRPPGANLFSLLNPRVAGLADPMGRLGHQPQGDGCVPWDQGGEGA